MTKKTKPVAAPLPSPARIVPHRLYAVQDENATHLVLQVDGDNPVVVLSYGRSTIAAAKSVTAMSIVGTPVEGHFLGVRIDTPPGVPQTQAPKETPSNGKV